MAVPSDDELIGAMREIINGSDLDQLTFKTILDVLSAKYGDLTERKACLKTQLTTIMSEGAPKETETIKAEDPQEIDEEPEAKPTNNKAKDDDNESVDDKEEKHEPEDDAGDISKESIEVQKLLLESIKFGGRPTRTTRSGATPSKREKKAPKKRKSKEHEEENADEGGESEKKPKKKARANKPKVLSPLLAEVIGESTLTRPEVVKRLHTYIKEHNLQDPKNGRKILLDDKLQQVFKKKTTDYFKMNALLSMHLTDPGELV